MDEGPQRHAAFNTGRARYLEAIALASINALSVKARPSTVPLLFNSGRKPYRIATIGKGKQREFGNHHICRRKKYLTQDTEGLI